MPGLGNLEKLTEFSKCFVSQFKCVLPSSLHVEKLFFLFSDIAQRSSSLSPIILSASVSVGNQSTLVRVTFLHFVSQSAGSLSFADGDFFFFSEHFHASLSAVVLVPRLTRFF